MKEQLDTSRELSKLQYKKRANTLSFGVYSKNTKPKDQIANVLLEIALYESELLSRGAICRVEEDLKKKKKEKEMRGLDRLTFNSCNSPPEFCGPHLGEY